MADTVSISQNVFLLIIAVIALVAVIVIVLQWRRVREAQSNVTFLEKQAELKKIELVERDLESKRLMENVIPLPKDQQERLSQIRSETSKMMQKVGFLHSEINERVTRLETRAEYEKLQKLLDDIEKKEAEMNKKGKFKGGK
jgi:23S rRNA maturation-related 3'-5' exoribonuclease YhaM